MSRLDGYEAMLPGESVEEYHDRIRSPEVAAIIAEGQELVLRCELAKLRGEPWPPEPAKNVGSDRPSEKWEPKSEESGLSTAADAEDLS